MWLPGLQMGIPLWPWPAAIQPTCPSHGDSLVACGLTKGIPMDNAFGCTPPHGIAEQLYNWNPFVAMALGRTAPPPPGSLTRLTLGFPLRPAGPHRESLCGHSPWPYTPPQDRWPALHLGSRCGLRAHKRNPFVAMILGHTPPPRVIGQPHTKIPIVACEATKGLARSNIWRGGEKAEASQLIEIVGARCGFCFVQNACFYCLAYVKCAFGSCDQFHHVLVTFSLI